MQKHVLSRIVLYIVIICLGDMNLFIGQVTVELSISIDLLS